MKRRYITSSTNTSAETKNMLRRINKEMHVLLDLMESDEVPSDLFEVIGLNKAYSAILDAIQNIYPYL